MEPEETVEPEAGDVHTDVAAPETKDAAAPASLADAINQALDPNAAKPVEKPTDEAASEVEGEEGEGAAEGDEKDGAKDAAKDGADAGKEKPGEKKLDHVNDPIPAQVSERTRERITSLVGTIKTQESELKNQGDLIASIQDTGASAEQFAETIQFLRNVNSNDPEALEAAYKQMKGAIRAISVRMGKAVPEADLLADHPDLAQKVKFGQMTDADAREMAVHRERAKIGQDSLVRTRDQAKEQQTFTKDKAEAITALNTLGRELRARDGALYEARFAAMTPILTEKFKTLPPKQWEAEFHREYNLSKAKAAVPKVDPVVPAVPAKQQPIRPVSPAGGAGGAPVKEPKSLAEAINFGIANGA